MSSDNIVRFSRPQHRSDARAYDEAIRAQQAEPWGPVRDYPERARFVRPMEPVDMAAASRDANLDLYRSRAEQERIDRIVEDVRRDDRALFWRGVAKFVGALALVYVLLTAALVLL